MVRCEPDVRSNMAVSRMLWAAAWADSSSARKRFLGLALASLNNPVLSFPFKTRKC